MFTILTVCTGDKFTEGLRFMIQAVQSAGLRLFCFDAGISPRDKESLLSERGVCILPMPNIASVPCDEPTAKMSWAKPFLVQSALKLGQRRIIWLDLDTIVLGDLKEFGRMVKEGPVFTPDTFAVREVKNKPGLGALLGHEDDLDVTINAGVLGLDLLRDKAIVDEWTRVVGVAAADERVRKLLSCFDQGALITTISKMGLKRRIMASDRWNRPANGCLWADAEKRKLYPREGVVEAVRADHPGISLVHWMGSRKLWMNW